LGNGNSSVGVELAGGAKLAALVEKVATSPVEKAAAGRSSGEDGLWWVATVGMRRHGKG
jgi:hypothetical protein